MKTTKLALVTLAVAGLAAFANTASARPDIHVSIGFGVPAPAVRYVPVAPVTYYPAPAPVIVTSHYRPDFRPAGYWKEVLVKTWVPARFVDTFDRRGRLVRMIEPGHFAYRTDRVWVNDHCG